MRAVWFVVARLARDRSALIGLVLIALLVAAALLAPVLSTHPDDVFELHPSERLRAPSGTHWLGTDRMGADVYSRLLFGARITILIGLIAVGASLLIGVPIGLVAGYFEGWWDRVVMRICDVLFAFPGILLAIDIVAILGGGMTNVIIAVSIFSIPTFARLVRGNTLALKHLTFIEAARSVGAPDRTIIARHIFPGTIAAVVVYFSLRIGTSIITAASLSFIGMGAQPPTPEWGAMLNEARADMMTSPHVALFPSLAIFLTVLAFNLLGDGLRDALDPKIDQK
jgi:glutathione transport system permease protein